MKTFASFLEKSKGTVEKVLQDFLPEVTKDGALEQTYEAMRYAVFSGDGGKRIRPALVLAAWEICSGQNALGAPQHVLECAAGIELIHTYTLVVDDIEDKSDLRRGIPACHTKFGIPTAIFSSGMLYERGLRPFHRLPPYVPPGCGDEFTGILMDNLHRGQTADMNSLGWNVGKRSLENLQFIHAAKTSALIQLALLGGAIGANASDAQKEALYSYGHFVGLAFQARDDVLSVIGDPKVLGKPTGPDADAGKLTYVSLFGSAEKAQQQAETLSQKARSYLPGTFKNARVLDELAVYAIERDR